MSELKKCPICHEQAKIGYACGDYFAHCSDGCPSPMCDHASESTTVCAWNDWAEWCEKYRRAQPERCSTHEVAVILAEAFKDDCACNFNGNDEWLPSVCDFANTACPNPAGVACWEQYLKHRHERSEG